uniref:Uncharacterized protein n=1 Tax=Romanomermis culicivorax TaxID=13658 RepID=A0A915I8D8_ROMCU
MKEKKIREREERQKGKQLKNKFSKFLIPLNKFLTRLTALRSTSGELMKTSLFNSSIETMLRTGSLHL